MIPAGDSKNSSFPWRAQTGWSPPTVEICQRPPCPPNRAVVQSGCEGQASQGVAVEVLYPKVRAGAVQDMKDQPAAIGRKPGKPIRARSGVKVLLLACRVDPGNRVCRSLSRAGRVGE